MYEIPFIKSSWPTISIRFDQDNYISNLYIQDSQKPLSSEVSNSLSLIARTLVTVTEAYVTPLVPSGTLDPAAYFHLDTNLPIMGEIE